MVRRVDEGCEGAGRRENRARTSYIAPAGPRPWRRCLLTAFETQVLGGGCLHADIVDSDAHGGYQIIDVDSVIAAQAPKMAPHRQQMRENLAAAWASLSTMSA